MSAAQDSNTPGPNRRAPGVLPSSNAAPQSPAEPDPTLLLESFFKGFKQTESGAKLLDEQRRRARKKKLAVVPADWRPAYLPVEENAASVYRELGKLLDQTPLTEAELTLLNRMTYRFQDSPEEVAAARALLCRRRPELNLARRAALRRDCDFGRDWSKGAELRFPEFMPMRSASRLVRAEAFLLSQDGRAIEAVETQRLGFRIAQHAAKDPTLLGRLISQVFRSVACDGLATILYQSGGRSDVALAVRSTLEQLEELPSWSYTLQGEAMMTSVMMLSLQEQELEGLYALLRKQPETPLERFPPATHSSWVQALQAVEARNLRRLLTIGELAEAAPTQRWRKARKLDAETGQSSLNLVDLLGGVFDIHTELVLARDAEGVGRTRTLILAAALLQYHDRHGEFPDDARAAMSRLPVDPCTGKPLRYRREGEGFVVFGVGTTGKYDGGTPSEPGNDARRGEAFFRYPAPQPSP